MRLHVAKGRAAGDVRQPAVEGIADAAAGGAEPVILRLAPGAAGRRRAGLTSIAPVDIGFKAPDPIAGLQL